MLAEGGATTTSLVNDRLSPCRPVLLGPQLCEAMGMAVVITYGGLLRIRMLAIAARHRTSATTWLCRIVPPVHILLIDRAQHVRQRRRRPTQQQRIMDVNTSLNEHAMLFR